MLLIYLAMRRRLSRSEENSSLSESLGVLQKAIGLKTVEFEELAYQSMCDLALSEGLDDEGLQRLSRKFIRLRPKRLYERVRDRDFECGCHKFFQIIPHSLSDCR